MSKSFKKKSNKYDIGGVIKNGINNINDNSAYNNIKNGINQNDFSKLSSGISSSIGGAGLIFNGMSDAYKSTSGLNDMTGEIAKINMNSNKLFGTTLDDLQNNQISQLRRYDASDVKSKTNVGKLIGGIGKSTAGGAKVAGLWGGVAGLLGGAGAAVTGLFNGKKKARKQANELNNLAKQAEINQQISYNNNLNNAMANRNQMMQASYFSNGGALEYSMYNDMLNTDMMKALSKIQSNGINNSLQNKYSNGGFTHGANFSNGVTKINEGGTHEENPLEGVMVGKDVNGTPNLVEEGEVIFDDYVFSNRLKVPNDTKKQLGISGKNTTFADALKQKEKESSERPNDPISKNYLEDFVAKLKDSQEDVKTKKQFAEMSPEDRQNMLNQYLNGDNQQMGMEQSMQQANADQQQQMQQEQQDLQQQANEQQGQDMQQQLMQQLAMQQQQPNMSQMEQQMQQGEPMYANGGLLRNLRSFGGLNTIPTQTPVLSASGINVPNNRVANTMDNYNVQTRQLNAMNSLNNVVNQQRQIANTNLNTKLSNPNRFDDGGELLRQMRKYRNEWWLDGKKINGKDWDDLLKKITDKDEDVKKIYEENKDDKDALEVLKQQLVQFANNGGADGGYGKFGLGNGESGSFSKHWQYQTKGKDMKALLEEYNSPNKLNDDPQSREEAQQQRSASRYFNGEQKKSNPLAFLNLADIAFDTYNVLKPEKPQYDTANFMMDYTNSLTPRQNAMISGYMNKGYFDQNRLINESLQASNQNARNLSNLSNGVGTTAAGFMLANGVDSQNKIGSNSVAGYMAGRDDDFKVEDFNRNTNIRNQDAINRANELNAQQDELKMRGYDNALNRIEDTRDWAYEQNLTKRNKFANDLTKLGAHIGDINTFNGTHDYWVNPFTGGVGYYGIDNSEYYKDGAFGKNDKHFQNDTSYGKKDLQPSKNKSNGKYPNTIDWNNLWLNNKNNISKSINNPYEVANLKTMNYGTPVGNYVPITNYYKSNEGNFGYKPFGSGNLSTNQYDNVYSNNLTSPNYVPIENNISYGSSGNSFSDNIQSNQQQPDWTGMWGTQQNITRPTHRKCGGKILRKKKK